VVNGTQGVPPDRIANLDVTLFQMGVRGPVTHTVQTDGRGRFAFDATALDPGTLLFARIDYGGIRYFSDILSAELAASRPLMLTVYEMAPLPANFQIERVQLALDLERQVLSGPELLQPKNSTDRAFLMPLPLPEGTSSIQFKDVRDDFRAVRRADGSVYYPVLPTTERILLSVQMVMQPPDYTLRLQVPVQIKQLTVLVEQTGNVQVTSPQLKRGQSFTLPASPEQPSPASYWRLNGTTLPAGSIVTVSISNLPGADNLATSRAVILAVGGLGALALLALSFIRKRGLAAITAGAADRRLARLQAIAALDEAFEAGENAEEEYLAARAALKAELIHASTRTDTNTEREYKRTPHNGRHKKAV
jgi:hypothetical protein